jgi:hypothetical protein
VTPPEVDRISPLPRDKAGLPEIEEAPAEDDGAGEPERSLRDDVEALIDDGKTYLEAELAYQKTRAAFVADRAKGTLIFGTAAALLGFLALIGLTVGLIIALTPLLTAWGASGLVVALLLIGALIAARAAGRRWSGLMAAIDSDKGPTA